MNTNRPWTILYTEPHRGKKISSGWATEKDALEFMAQKVDERCSISGIKFDGKLVTATHVFALLRKAGIRLVWGGS